MRKCITFALLLVGCDFGVSGVDGGNSDLSMSTPSAQAVVTPDLVGFPTTLSAVESSDPAGRTLSYTWHFVNVPQGSAITDASLSSTTAPTVTFEPDLGGDYSLMLTVTAGADSANLMVSGTVPTVPIFYQQGTFGTSNYETAVGLMRSDGTG